MKTFIFTLLASISLTFSASAQQVSLYDSEGEARAYIDYDQERTIFMWDGTPVAFLEKDGNDLAVFGFDGSFLGWYEDGTIYNKGGQIVGARKDATIRITRMERMKGIQKMTPIRPITPITPIQPILKSSWSDTPLAEFLYSGKK